MIVFLHRLKQIQLLKIAHIDLKRKNSRNYIYERLRLTFVDALALCNDVSSE